MVESIVMSAAASSLPPPPFAGSETSSSSTTAVHLSENELLEMQIAETRAQLQALREEGSRQRVEQAQQYQSLQSNYETLQHTLTKSSSRLNMFLYTHAMLQAQTTVVQPYILKKQALLCHAFHHNEVLTKQIHLRQVHADALVTVLEQGKEQIVEFWQARLSNLQRSLHDTLDDAQQWRDRITMLLPQPPSHTTTTSSSQLKGEVIIEEEEEYEDDDDNMSSSTSSSSQWTEEPSPPPPHQPQQQQQDMLLQVLSMALTAVSEGRLPSVFDMKSLSAPSSPVKSSSSNSDSHHSHHRTLTPTKASMAKTAAALPKQLEDAWDEEGEGKALHLRRSYVGMDTF